MENREFKNKNKKQQQIVNQVDTESVKENEIIKNFGKEFESEKFFKTLSLEKSEEYTSRGVVISRKAISKKCKESDKFYRYND